MPEDEVMITAIQGRTGARGYRGFPRWADGPVGRGRNMRERGGADQAVAESPVNHAANGGQCQIALLEDLKIVICILH